MRFSSYSLENSRDLDFFGFSRILLDSLYIISDYVDFFGIILKFSYSLRLFRTLLHTLSVSLGFSQSSRNLVDSFIFSFVLSNSLESRIYSDSVLFVRILCILFKCQILSNCRIRSNSLLSSRNLVGFSHILLYSSGFSYIPWDSFRILFVFSRIVCVFFRILLNSSELL